MRVILAIFLSAIFLKPIAQTNNREELYVHFNSTFLLTGETLQFSIYTSNGNSGKLSRLSKIAYLELVNKDREAVFQKKILMEDGHGYGEFFLSSLISTGSYQLIAYTKWMRNYEDFFIQEIQIVNPFESYKENLPQTSSQVKIEFHPEGGHLVVNKENLLAYKILGDLNTVKNIRLIDQEGNNLQTLTYNNKGYGSIHFTPLMNQTYKIIIENKSGNFEFTEIPKATNAPKLSVMDNGDAIEVEVVDNINQQNKYKIFSINSQQEQVWEQNVFSNSPVLLDKELFESGLYQFKSENTNIQPRAFYYSSISNQNSKEHLGQFNLRQKIELPLKYDVGSMLSISVRKIDDLYSTAPSSLQHRLFGNSFLSSKDLNLDITDKEFIDDLLLTNNGFIAKNNVRKFNLTPEVRGEIVTGSISHSKLPLENVEIFIAFVSNGSHLFFGKTDTAGHFSIQIDGLYENQLAYIGVTNNQEGYGISVDNPFLDEYPPLTFNEVILDSILISQIVERSIRNQIENGYYEPIKYRNPEKVWDTFGQFTYSYFLDDYNRFPQLHEHFIEYIPSVTARKSKSKSKLSVNLHDYISGYDPLILLDGVPAQVDQLFEFSPYKVQKIEIIDTRLYIGPAIFDGAVSLHTFENDLMGFEPIHLASINYIGIDRQPIYTFPNYQLQKLNRIPNKKDQLYWNPELKLTKDGPFFLEFHTGDVTGKFEISIEGYGPSGEPISIKKQFEVVTNSPDAN